MNYVKLFVFVSILSLTQASRLISNCIESHGCPTCAGFTWCNATQTCIRPWVTDCPDLAPY